MAIRVDMRRTLCWLLIGYLLYGTSAFAQVGDLGSLDIPRKGKLKGITSFRTNTNLFLAVWYAMPSEKVEYATQYSLCIFECTEGRYKEVFQLSAEGDDTWNELMCFDSARLPGVVIFLASGTSSRGPAIVIGLVRNKFEIVYRGDESEFVDINADGIPEILESVWPDGDGYPKATTIHIWNGNSYRPLMKVRWGNRFSQAVGNAVRKASRSLSTR
jgi:hypothetical protein